MLEMKITKHLKQMQAKILFSNVTFALSNCLTFWLTPSAKAAVLLMTWAKYSASFSTGFKVSNFFLIAFNRISTSPRPRQIASILSLHSSCKH